MKLIFATNNKNKLAEFRRLTQGMDIEVVSQREAGCDFEADENGTTFEENAYIKAKAAVDATGLPAVADDSGLSVDALNGEPGIYSARYGPGHDATDAERYNYLLDKMAGITDRSARFVCCMCCVFPNGDTVTSRGECEGVIGDGPKGEYGFGYDPVFIPNDGGNGRHMAELTPDEKNSISHRGKALRKFIPELQEYLNGINK